MKHEQNGSVLLLVLIIIGIISLFAPLLFEMQIEGMSALHHRHNAFVMKQHGLRVLKSYAQLENSVTLSCDEANFSVLTLLTQSAAWWERHACVNADIPGLHVFVIREPPQLSHVAVIEREGDTRWAVYRRLVLRMVKTGQRSLVMVGMAATPSDKQAVKREGVRVIPAGLISIQAV